MPDLGQRNPLNLVLVVGENLPSNLSSPLIFVLFLSSQIFYKLAKKKFFHKTSFLSLKKGQELVRAKKIMKEAKNASKIKKTKLHIQNCLIQTF